MGLNPGLNTQGSSISVLIQNALVKVKYDEIDANYAGATADVYTYKYLTATVATLTVNWTDNTKSVLSSVIVT